MRAIYWQQLTTDWREEYRASPTYSGRNLLRLSAFDVQKHTTSPAHGDSKWTMAKFCWAVRLGHAPLGIVTTTLLP